MSGGQQTSACLSLGGAHSPPAQNCHIWQEGQWGGGGACTTTEFGPILNGLQAHVLEKRRGPAFWQSATPTAGRLRGVRQRDRRQMHRLQPSQILLQGMPKAALASPQADLPTGQPQAAEGGPHVSGRLHSHQTTTSGAAIVICTMLTDASTLSKYSILSLPRGGMHELATHAQR